MKSSVRYVASTDKSNWFKNHSLTEEARKKLIDDKVKRVLNQMAVNEKVKFNFLDR